MDSTLADLVKEGILQMCSQLKPEAVAIADSLAPPDFVLNSVIGKSDGKVCTVETCSKAGSWVLLIVRRQFRMLHNEEHGELHRSCGIVKRVKCRRM